MSKILKRILIGALVITVMMAIIGLIWRPPVDGLHGEVPFHSVYEDAIVTIDIYDLSDEELASKYADQTLHVRNFPGRDVRYMLLTDDDAKLQRISVRGTDNLRNAVVDAQYSKWVDKSLNVYLHRGFQDAATEIFQDALPHLRKDYKTIVTGHSLGGAIAAILMMHLETQGYPIERVTTFGQPMVTNEDGAAKFAKSKLLRIVNLEDIVTKVPPSSLLGSVYKSYRHFAPEVVLLKDNKYLFQVPRLPSSHEIEAATDELRKEDSRGLWSDYLSAHRMVNYIAHLQEIMKNGKRVQSATISDDLEGKSNPVSTTRPTRLALLVGVNDYKADALPDLAGCVNDVHAMKSLLIGQYGFAAQDVRVLTNAAATREEIIRAVRENLIERAKENDTVLFYFSGLGSRVMDKTGDESDGWDETIVPYDGRQGDVIDISDDEFNDLVHELKPGVDLVTVLDCCHSRGDAVDPTVRYVDSDGLGTAVSANLKIAGASLQAESFRDSSDYTLISAAQPDQSAHEFSYQGKINGAMTYFFVNEAKRIQNGKRTYQVVVDSVQLAVNKVYADQSPQLASRRSDAQLFAAAANASRAFITVSRRPDGAVVLLAGQAHGMTVGSTFDVYAPGTTNLQSAKAIDRLTLTKLHPFTSEVKSQNRAMIPYASQAIETNHEYGDFKFYVYVAGNSTIETELKQSIAKHAYIQLVDSAAKAQVEISVHADQVHVTSASNGIAKYFANSSDSILEVEAMILHLSKWFNLLLLDNPESNLQIELRIGQDLAKVQKFQVGQRTPISVRNLSSEKLYFSIIDLESTGDVIPLFPKEGQSVELLPGAQWTGTPRFNLPAGQKEVSDFLKLIATREPISVHFLQAKAPPALRGGSMLEKLLTDAAFGSRSAEAISIGSDSWATYTVKCVTYSAE